MNFEDLTIHEKPEQSPGFLLWHVSTTWRRAIEGVLEAFSLTHPQFVVLATLGWLTRKEDAVTQVEISKLAGLDPNTNSQIIKGLEKKGLLQRSLAKDARAKRVALTAKGKKILSSALPTVERADGEFFAPLTEKELKGLVQQFQHLVMYKKGV